MLIFGWAPGQIEERSIILKPHPSFLLKSQQVFIEANKQHLEEFGEKYFLNAEEFENNSGNIPYFINPLLFNEYDIKKIKTVISSLGWENPKDTDSNSTNCLLNTLANFLHERKYGYNPYVQEVSEMIRSGIISREEGLNRMEDKFNKGILLECVGRLGIDCNILEGG